MKRIKVSGFLNTIMELVIISIMITFSYQKMIATANTVILHSTERYKLRVMTERMTGIESDLIGSIIVFIMFAIAVGMVARDYSVRCRETKEKIKHMRCLLGETDRVKRKPAGWNLHGLIIYRKELEEELALNCTEKIDFDKRTCLL